MNNDKLTPSYNGKLIDERYKVIEPIGSGGMSVVFKARDQVRNRTVAMKLLSGELEFDDKAVRRFANESKAAAMVSSENIVKIYDVNLDHDPKYIVMEYVNGMTLKDYMSMNAPLETDEAVSIMEQLLKALSATHEKNIVHRDVKPQNVMVTPDLKLKLMDFGIAKLPGSKMLEEDEKAMGTVHYISPEQASGKNVGPGTDVYSAGVIFYEMLTGKLPFDGETPLSVAMMHVNNPPVLPRKYNEKIPPALEQIIMKAMKKEPSQRFSSAASMLKALRLFSVDHRTLLDRETLDNIDSTSLEPKKTTEENKPQKVKTRHGRRTMFPIILGVSCAFLLVALIAAAIMGFSLLNMTKNSSLTVIVPDLYLRDFNDSLQLELKDANIKVAQVEYVFDRTAPRGQIISQLPEAGSRKKIADNNHFVNLTLKVSKGSENIPVPDLTVTEYRRAIVALGDLELGYSIQMIYSNTILEGYVVSTDPAAGTEVAKNTEVVLFVSSGQELSFVTMPSLIGKTLPEAKKELSDSSLLLGKVTREPSEAETGTVIAQSVDADSSVAKKYTVVDLTLSIKAPPTTVPPPTEPATSVPEFSDPPFTSAPESSAIVTAPPTSTEAPPTHTTAPTSVPASTAPHTSAHATTVPPVTSPGSTAPASTQPASTAPSTSAPPASSEAPDTSEDHPVTTEPASTAPETSAPASTAPSTSAPESTIDASEPPASTAPSTETPDTSEADTSTQSQTGSDSGSGGEAQG
ncbi:MAG: Stk1 family PASTA domain-containing Ser/Thr kinase [Clostridia bacterium]|nr:Stk1 family PASTA domain-containing Ser/Thr kinase [Clostridia bacterium]